MRKVLLLLFLYLLHTHVHAQNSPLIKGVLLHHFTKEPVPFAGISWLKENKGVITDSAGFFSIASSKFLNDTLVIQYVGYEKIFKPATALKPIVNNILYIKEAKFSDEVIVKSKFNKGLRWFNNIIKHKATNNPYKYNTYAYELYNKLEIDIANVKKETIEQNKLLKPFAFILNNVDSVSETAPFIPVFLTETISDVYVSHKPNKIREEIKAIQTNGIKNETIMQFMGGLTQQLNVYNDFITLFGKTFISPISQQGANYYFYKGADTQTINNEKYYHLLFTPLQQGSNTFTGDCWIHSTTWAIQKMSISISATANINFVQQLSVVQEFSKLSNNNWVLWKDKIVANLSPFKKQKISFIGRKTNTYKNIEVNAHNTLIQLQKNKTNNESSILPTATEKPIQYWQQHRHETLNTNEKNVYALIDTLGKMPLFRQYANTVDFLLGGYKKYGLIEIGPWYKWVSGNQRQKIRVRFDIGTSEQFSKYLKLNGYLAYGFGDARFKGKGTINYTFKHQPKWAMQAVYLNDLDNGRIKINNQDATTDNMFSQIIRRKNIPQKFLGIEEWRFGISYKPINTVLISTNIINSKYETFNPLPLQRNFTTTGTDVINTEWAIKLRYAPSEKTIQTKRRQIRIKGNYPVFETRFGVGIPNSFKSEYSYKKISGTISQTIKLNTWGKIDYLVYGGKYFGNNLPFMILEVHPGNEIYYYHKYAFNLMNRFEYISDEYVGFTLEHNFEKKLLNLIPPLRKTKIRQLWTLKTVWGNLNGSNRQFNKLEFPEYRLKILRGNHYAEIGTGIDNIFKYFRIDAVWRFNPAFRVPSNSRLANSVQYFGIFGSMHVQF